MKYRRTFDYEPSGRLSATGLEDLDLSKAIEHQYGYNWLGEAIIETLPSGDILHRSYDVLGQMTDIWTDSGSFQAHVDYYATGQPETVSGTLQGSGTLDFIRSVGFDSRQRLTSLSLDVNGQQSAVTYGYYQNGQIETTTDTLRQMSFGYEYDSVGRLTYASGYGSVGGASSYRYYHHYNGTLDRVDVGGEVRRYFYDTTSFYRPTTIERDGQTHTAMTYTASGARCEMTQPDENAIYSWTGDGRLGRLTLSGARESTQDFFYDYTGQRWKSAREADTVLYSRGDQLDTDTDAIREHVSLPFVRCQLPTSQLPGRCYFSDQLNTTSAFEEDGTAGWRVAYTPYGSELTLEGEAGDLQNRFGFNGKDRVADGSLLYYGARHYDPNTRLWLSVDPLRPKGVQDALGVNSMNPYIFASSDPISKWDADGRNSLLLKALQACACERFSTPNILGIPDSKLGVKESVFAGMMRLAVYRSCLALTGGMAAKDVAIHAARTAGTRLLVGGAVVLGAGLTGGGDNLGEFAKKVETYTGGFFNVIGHSNGSNLILKGVDESETVVTVKALAHWIRQQKEYVAGRPIRLVMCRAGKCPDTSLAKKLAQFMKVKVMGPNVRSIVTGGGAVKLEKTPGVRRQWIVFDENGKPMK